jgi:hypothetical protein
MTQISLPAVLRADAALGFAMGVALALAAGPVAGLTGLPPGLLRGAGLALLPVAAFMAWAARPAAPRRAGRAVVIGNCAWVAASLGLLVSGFVAPNALGTAFVLAQAAVVAGFAWAEATALRAAPRAA